MEDLEIAEARRPRPVIYRLDRVLQVLDALGDLTLQDPQSTQAPKKVRKKSFSTARWMPAPRVSRDKNAPWKKTKDPRGWFPGYDAETEALSTARMLYYYSVLLVPTPEDLQMTQAPKENQHPFASPPWKPPETPIVFRDPNAPRIKTKDPRRLFNWGPYHAVTDFERAASIRIARCIIPDPTPSGRARLAPTAKCFGVPLTTDTDGTPQAPESSRQAHTISDPDARHQRVQEMQNKLSIRAARQPSVPYARAPNAASASSQQVGQKQDNDKIDQLGKHAVQHIVLGGQEFLNGEDGPQNYGAEYGHFYCRQGGELVKNDVLKDIVNHRDDGGKLYQLLLGNRRRMDKGKRSM